MLVVNNMQRVFLFTDNGQEVRLSDPDMQLNPQGVLNFYSNTYPTLTTARIEGPEIEDDQVRFKFVSTLGTKG